MDPAFVAQGRKGIANLPERKEDSGQLNLFQLARRKSVWVEVRQLAHPIWTKNKSRLIEAYLRYFVLITKHGYYIDGFAGPQRHREESMWSAKRVLESSPPFLDHFFLFDSNADQTTRLRALATAHDGKVPAPGYRRRHVEVLHGDFNELIDSFLARNPIPSEKATFCLLDQRTFECHWRTVEKLAKYKNSGPHKIEVFYFLAQGWLNRALRATRDEKILEAWWGRDDWGSLRAMSPIERAVAVCNRFRELGYADVKPWPIYRSGSSSKIMYHMIHATDHLEAPKLMRRAYEKALGPPEPIEQFNLEFSLGADRL